MDSLPFPPGRRRRSQLLFSLSWLAGAVLFLTATQYIRPASALFGIGEQRFKYEGLIDVGALGMDSADGMVAAVGDLDGEQL